MRGEMSLYNLKLGSDADFFTTSSKYVTLSFTLNTWNKEKSDNSGSHLERDGKVTRGMICLSSQTISAVHSFVEENNILPITRVAFRLNDISSLKSCLPLSSPQHVVFRFLCVRSDMDEPFFCVKRSTSTTCTLPMRRTRSIPRMRITTLVRSRSLGAVSLALLAVHAWPRLCHRHSHTIRRDEPAQPTFRWSRSRQLVPNKIS